MEAFLLDTVLKNNMERSSYTPKDTTVQKRNWLQEFKANSVTASKALLTSLALTAPLTAGLQETQAQTETWGNKPYVEKVFTPEEESILQGSADYKQAWLNAPENYKDEIPPVIQDNLREVMIKYKGNVIRNPNIFANFQTGRRDLISLSRFKY